MRDEILDWIEDHRFLTIFLIVIVILVILAFGVRSYNLSHKEEETETQPIETTVEVTTEQKSDSSYKSSLNTKDKSTEKGTIKIEVTQKETVQELKPNFEATCEIFDWTDVPNKNVDGSSYKDYLKGVSLKDFGTKWGTKLDINDMKTRTRHMIGVEQDENNKEIADLQSVGWLINHLSDLNKHDAVKFTNLHVIGKLSNDHVAVLCSYDWYSAFGLKDTMVVFEDISNTLKVKDFKDGSVFSATVFVHNIKNKVVNGQNVICVQYTVFK